MERESCDIGLIGLAVMGQNLVLNMNDHGYRVAVFNRTVSKVDEFIHNEAAGTRVVGTHSIEEFVQALKRPRRVMLMVKAGSTVDEMIAALLPHLEKGDILIDGGNSHYTDTNRRTRELAAKGILFIGTGVSGGEEGARHGPSIMPGGNPAAWPHVKDIFQAIAAKVEDGSPCCDWVGEDGAGHYVKMVHNGIEYGDMQLICEAYHLMHAGLGLSADELHEVFADWNRGELDSYLIEITAEIFKKKDDDGTPLIDKILDTAGQKGTGKWTGISALELGTPLRLIGEAVFARCLSALKEERVKASTFLPAQSGRLTRSCRLHRRGSPRAILFQDDFLCPRLHAVARSGEDQKWNLNFGGIALMWRGGCIIRSRFLGKIKEAYDKNPQLNNLLLDGFFSKVLNELSGFLAEGHRSCHRRRCPHTGFLDRPVVLRWLPHRPFACQPATGTTGLLRRPHLRTRRQAARRILPHQLDRPRRPRGLGNVQCVRLCCSRFRAKCRPDMPETG